MVVVIGYRAGCFHPCCDLKMSVRKDWQLRDRIESDWGNELGIGSV